LPPEMREHGLFAAVKRPDGVIELRPQRTVDAAQAWFWTDRWHRMEREAQAEIEAGRVERFADSTDMCSLVNAKSGGCAEDCGFCAQSRFADAETPMHAMMEPEQILEHARAAEAAGAHRFCMVTQGQGLSKRDFDKYLQGVRLVSEKTNLKRLGADRTGVLYIIDLNQKGAKKMESIK